MPVSQVAAGVYRLSLAWSNCYVLTGALQPESGPVWLIDCGLQKDRPELLRGLKEIGVRPDRICTVVLTHGHCDHAGSAAFFHEEYGAAIMAHHEESPFLRMPRRSYGGKGWRSFIHPAQWMAFQAGELIFPIQRVQNLTELTNSQMLPAPGGDLKVIHCPGHTQGHIALLRESDRLLFSGDAVMTIVPNVVPRLRRGGISLPLRLFSDDWDQAKASKEALLGLKPAILAAGHGRPAIFE